MAGADVHVPAHMIAEEAVQQDVFPVLSIGDARDFPGETRGGGIVHHRLLLLRGGGDRSRGVGAAPDPARIEAAAELGSQGASETQSQPRSGRPAASSGTGPEGTGADPRLVAADNFPSGGEPCEIRLARGDRQRTRDEQRPVLTHPMEQRLDPLIGRDRGGPAQQPLGLANVGHEDSLVAGRQSAYGGSRSRPRACSSMATSSLRLRVRA